MDRHLFRAVGALHFYSEAAERFVRVSYSALKGKGAAKREKSDIAGLLAPARWKPFTQARWC